MSQKSHVKVVFVAAIIGSHATLSKKTHCVTRRAKYYLRLCLMFDLRGFISQNIHSFFNSCSGGN